MKAKYYFLVILVVIQVSVRAQMKIGNNSTTINSASLLELESTNKGLVFPRVSLTAVGSSSPLPATLLTGTVVFNTNASVTNGNGVGLYVWTGSSWQSLAMNLSSSAWQLTGNSGTSYSTNFLGTTDNTSLRFRTNNTEQMIIDSLGKVGIGSSSFSTTNPPKLLVDYGTTTSNTVMRIKGNTDTYMQINLQNFSSSSTASTDYVATSDDGTDSTYYIDMGINSSTYAPDVENWGGPHDGYLYTYGRNLIMGVQGTSADVIFLLGGGKIKTNAALRLNGADGNIIVGKGENSNLPVGNTVRGPNASSSATNTAGGDITFIGGSSTGTATGGSVNIKSGSSSSGTYGSVNINASLNGTTNINTGTSGSNVTVGGNANNILLPKFSTVGGIFYTSVNTGQVSTTGSNMTWDSINNRLGIGISNPGYKLSVLSSSNPLYLSGVQATGSFNSDSILTILNGVVKKAPYSSLTNNFWNLAGNGGTTAGTNFIGTTDAVDFIAKTNNTERMHILGANSGSSKAGWIGMGITLPRSSLDVTGDFTNKNVITIQNTSSTGYSSVDMMDNSGNLKATFGYGNSGTGSFFGSRNYFSTYGSDFVLTNNSASSYNFFLNGTSGNIGINTASPGEGLDVANKNIIISNSNNSAGQLKFQEPSSSGSNYVAFKAPVTSTNTTYTLPTADGSANQVLSTDGSGNLSWASSGGSGWALTGNSGTSTSTNFVGTTDGNGLVFKVNNTQAGYLGLSGSSYATAFGVGSSGTSTGFKATAIGASASATANTSVALGFSTTASAQDAVAIGDAASATTSNEAIAIGHSATSSASQGIALGVSANASTNNQTIAIGSSANATGYQGIAIGYSADATSNNSAMAIGVNASASGYQSTAVGNSASASAQNSTAIGNGATTSQTNALVLGNSSTNVGIGTSTPNTSTKLDVDGSFKLGSSGSVLSNIIKTSVTINPGSVTTSGTTTVTATVTGATTNSTVIVNPRSTLSNGLAIAYAYVSGANTITIAFVTNTAVDPPSMTLDVTVIQ